MMEASQRIDKNKIDFATLSAEKASLEDQVKSLSEELDLAKAQILSLSGLQPTSQPETSHPETTTVTLPSLSLPEVPPSVTRAPRNLTSFPDVQDELDQVWQTLKAHVQYSAKLQDGLKLIHGAVAAVHSATTPFSLEGPRAAYNHEAAVHLLNIQQQLKSQGPNVDASKGGGTCPTDGAGPSNT